MHTHSPKKVFLSFRTKIARPSSRRRFHGARNTPHQETTIISAKNTFTAIQKQSHPPVRIFASHQTHIIAQHISLRAFTQKKAKRGEFSLFSGEKKMKNLNERILAPPEEPNANGAFNRSVARSFKPILARAKTNGFLKEREREYTHVCVFARTFFFFYDVRRVSNE